MKLTSSKWFLPLFAVALGIVMFVAQSIGGQPLAGLASLGIMTGSAPSCCSAGGARRSAASAATAATSAFGSLISMPRRSPAWR